MDRWWTRGAIDIIHQTCSAGVACLHGDGRCRQRWARKRITAHYMRNLSSGEIRTHLERMAAVGRVTTHVTKQTTRYRAVGVEGVDGVDVLKGAETVYTFPPPPAPPAAHQPIPAGVDKNEGGSTPSTPQHLQHPAASEREPSLPTPQVLTRTSDWQEVLQGWASPPGAATGTDQAMGKHDARLLPRPWTGGETIRLNVTMLAAVRASLRYREL